MSKSVVDCPDFTVAQRGYVARYTTKPSGGGSDGVSGALFTQAFLATTSGILVAHATRPAVVPDALLHVARFGVIVFVLAAGIVLFAAFCTFFRMAGMFPPEEEAAIPPAKLPEIHAYLSKLILPTYAAPPAMIRAIRPLFRANRWAFVAAMIVDGYVATSVALVVMLVFVWGAEAAERGHVIGVIRKMSDADIATIEAVPAGREAA